jgi:hypothetical protein
MVKKVLSCKVTPDVYDAWQNMALGQNKTVSECMRDVVTHVDLPKVLKASKGIEIPDEVEKTLMLVGGGAVIGIIIYKSVLAGLRHNKNHGLDDGEMEAASTVLGISAALLFGTGLLNHLNKKS